MVKRVAMNRICSALIRFMLLGAAGAAAVGAQGLASASEFRNLIESRFVHCAFYRGYETDPATGDLLLIEGKSQSLTHYQSIDAERARTIDTRLSGAREARVVRTGKHLHFIDRVAGMYIVTTVHSCLDRDERRGVCLTYGASNARHFDSRVLLDPDHVFAELRARADPGFCDYSFIGVQETSRR